MTSRGVLAVSAAVLALSLAACGSSSNDSSSSSKPHGAAVPSAPAEQSTAAATAPKSDIDAAVNKAIAALDQLGIKHTTPTRTAVGGSGAKAVFDIKIDGYGAGINVFPDVAALKGWQKLSDQFGGVDVSFDSTALSLNSQKGINDSVAIAPKLARALGGEAHGV